MDQKNQVVKIARDMIFASKISGLVGTTPGHETHPALLCRYMECTRVIASNFGIDDEPFVPGYIFQIVIPTRLEVVIFHGGGGAGCGHKFPVLYRCRGAGGGGGTRRLRRRGRGGCVFNVNPFQ